MSVLIDSQGSELTVPDIPVVREIINVLLDELSGLSCKRDIDFAIEVQSRVDSIQ